MKFEKVYFLLLFLLLIIINFNNLNLPYYWDDFNYVIPAADYVYNNGPTIFLWEYGQGHPPFFYILSGLIFKIFGDSQLVGHLITLSFAFLAVLFTYLLGKELFSRKVGIISSLLLLFTPIFVSYSSLFFLEMPLTALLMMSLYYTIKEKPYLSIIFGSLAVLTKEIAIVAVFSIFIYEVIKKKEYKSLVYITPILVFILLTIFNKIYYGHFLYPISTSLIILSPIKNIFTFILVLKNIFFDQFRWILTSIIILSLISKNIFKKNKKQIIYSAILSLILSIIIFSLKFLKFPDYFPNYNQYMLLLQKFSFLIIILFFLLIINIKEFFNLYLRKDFYGIYSVLLIVIVAHFLIIPFAPRYILFIYPLIFLIFGFAINKLFNKYSYLVVLILIILFISSYHGTRSSVGFTLEDNLEYVDFIKVRQLGADYIASNFADSNVLTTFPLSADLSYPYGKYVSHKINTITLEPHPGIIYKNYTQYINPETVPKKEINLSQIDLYYYSPQQFPNKKIEDIADKLDLTMIKRFEINNKTAEIYLVNKDA